MHTNSLKSRSSFLPKLAIPSVICYVVNSVYANNVLNARVHV